ncbi:tyrosine-type recombinase/integrase [Streptosporangium sp. NPDC001682]
MLSRAAGEEGMPFVLAADGSYDLQLNRFLRELPGRRVRSPHTIAAYAHDLAVFGRFLDQRRGGLTLWEAKQQDLLAYQRARRQTAGEFRVSASTWNRFLAALTKWVTWALSEQLLEVEPFRMVEKTVLTPWGSEVVRINALREVDEEASAVRFLAYEDYLTWRDVGLRGQLPDGRPDPAWRGRHGERNAMFADLLVGTGMRLTEASSLLVSEVPPPLNHGKVGDLHLPPSITKRAKARTVFISRRVLRNLHQYLDIERDELVHRKRADGSYAKAAGWIGMVSASRASVLLAGGGRKSFRELSIEDRLRLRRMDGTVPGEPLWLWLGEDGLPLARSTWQAVFRRANERCARFGLDLEVHPHMLRHTFAVHMLGLLLRQTVKALRLEPGESLMSQRVKRMLIGDPLRRLQLLLGHRHRETVFIYLDVLDEAQEIVLAALQDWDEQAEALARVKVPELGEDAA